MPTVIATIDVGTNTAKLLLARRSGRAMEPFYEEERFVRLGEGVDASGVIGEAAIGRLLAVLRAYKEMALAHGAAQIVVGATSASRDAQNREALRALVRDEIGLDYEILSGEDEALWSFRAAVAAFGDLSGPCASIDIGGGSTEIAIGRAGGTVERLHSFDVGSVRLAERFFAKQPPSRHEVRSAQHYAERLVAEAALPLSGMPLVGVAGTLVALLFVDRGVASWAELAGQRSALTQRSVERWWERLCTMTFEEVLALDEHVMTGRADVFPAGVLILHTIMTCYDLPACRVSSWGLHHGLALRAMSTVTRLP